MLNRLTLFLKSSVEFSSLPRGLGSEIEVWRKNS